MKSCTFAALKNNPEPDKTLMKYFILVKIFIFCTLILFSYSLWQRQPDIDDAWIGEHAYWMAEKGYVKSELMHGITGQETRHIVHHKAFTLVGALFISIFGFSLTTLKSVSLLFLGIFLIIFARYVWLNMGKEAAWLSLLIIMSNALIFQYSFVFRPEIMVMTLGFVSYLFLEKGLSQERKLLAFLLGGVFAGLAAATHLNGLIFMVAGALLLLWNKRIKATVLFSLASLPAFAIYFYDFSEKFGISYWLYQINDSPALQKSSVLPASLSFFAKMLNEQMRFFHSPKEITFSLLFIFLLVVNFKNLKKHSNLLRYLFLLIVSLSLVAVHSTSKYMLLYIPYIFLIIITSLYEIYQNKSSSSAQGVRLAGQKPAVISLLLVLVYLSVNSFWNVRVAFRKFDVEKNVRIAEKYMDPNTHKLNILAPMTYIFNEMGNFKRIQSDLSLAEMQKAGKKIAGSQLLNYADSMKIDYLLITDEYKDRFKISSISVADLKKYGFTIVGNEPGIIILKNNPQNQ